VGLMRPITYRWTCHSLVRLRLENGGLKKRCRGCAGGKASVQVLGSDARICAMGGRIAQIFSNLHRFCTLIKHASERSWDPCPRAKCTKRGTSSSDDDQPAPPASGGDATPKKPAAARGSSGWKQPGDRGSGTRSGTDAKGQCSRWKGIAMRSWSRSLPCWGC